MAPAARRLITLVADDLLAEHSEQGCPRVLVDRPGIVHRSAGMIKANHATCRVFTEVDVR